MKSLGGGGGGAAAGTSGAPPPDLEADALPSLDPVSPRPTDSTLELDRIEDRDGFFFLSWPDPAAAAAAAAALRRALLLFPLGAPPLADGCGRVDGSGAPMVVAVEEEWRRDLEKGLVRSWSWL